MTTIHGLVSNIKGNIDRLNNIADTLLAEYRIAADIIDENTDHRQKPLARLEELNESLKAISENCSVNVEVDKLMQFNVSKIIAVGQDGY